MKYYMIAFVVWYLTLVALNNLGVDGVVSGVAGFFVTIFVVSWATQENRRQKMLDKSTE